MALSAAQKSIATSTRRFRVAVCGRRFGKTTLALREMARYARYPNRLIYYIAPSYRMAKQIMWKKLKRRLTDLNWIRKINESDLSVTLINGTEISLRSADAYDSMRGVGLDFLVLDEAADMTEEVWYEVLRPTLSDTGGHAMFLGTPKGMNWLKDIFDMQLIDPDNWQSWQFTSIDGGRIPQDEIEQAQRDLDARTFRQEYLATFEQYAGLIYTFSRERNCRAWDRPLPFQLHIGMDFNYGKMCAAVFHKQANELHLIDEIVIQNSNTDEMVEEIRSRYQQAGEARDCIIYPDPAARQNKTSAGGRTDLTILQNAGFTVKAPFSHTAVKDRINAVNSKLLSANGSITLFVDPRCRNAIECLERQTYREGTGIPDKDSGFDHMNDAIGYCVDYLFPIKRTYEPKPHAPKTWSHRIQ